MEEGIGCVLGTAGGRRSLRSDSRTFRRPIGEIKKLRFLMN